MKIIGQRKSIEQCTESGWDAFDYLLESPLTEEEIRSMRCLEGSFLYLSKLRAPFFKIESHHYVIKGVKGDCHFRIAVHKDDLDEVPRIRKLLSPEDSFPVS